MNVDRKRLCCDPWVNIAHCFQAYLDMKRVLHNNTKDITQALQVKTHHSEETTNDAGVFLGKRLHFDLDRVHRQSDEHVDRTGAHPGDLHSKCTVFSVVTN